MTRMHKRMTLAIALALAACGGGEPVSQGASVESLAQARPLGSAPNPLASAVAQPPQAAPIWVPTAAGLMQWAEQTYPHFFPAGAQDRQWSAFTYRRYPQTGNILAVAGEGIYIAGPVSGGPATLVGRLIDFSCAINPSGCVAAPEPVVAPSATGPTVRPTNVLYGVDAVLAGSQQIGAVRNVGGQLNWTTISGYVDGHVQLLAGKTIYVIIEDPHQLFYDTPSVDISSSGRVSVLITGRPLLTRGLREGNLKIYVCLDRACSTQLGGSPLLVPYQVLVVGDNIAVDPSSVTVENTFGEAPAPRSIGVTLPARTVRWGAHSNGFSIPITSTNLLGNTQGNVTFTMPLRAPGIYSDSVEIWADVGLPYVGSVTVQKFISIRHVVKDNPVLKAAIDPAQIRIAAAKGEIVEVPNVKQDLVIQSPGVYLAKKTLEFLSWPSGVAENQQLSWWSMDYATARTCGGNYCLPVGTYTAREVYTLNGGTPTTSLYRTVTLQIYP